MEREREDCYCIFKQYTLKTYCKHIGNFCIHGNPAYLRSHTEHAQWVRCFAALSLTAAVAMATDTVTVMETTAELAAKIIAMVTTVVDTWSRSCLQHFGHEEDFDLCPWRGILKHCCGQG